MKKINWFVLLVMTALLALAGCGGGKTINLNDYVKVTFTGSNGYGKPELSLDEAGLQIAIDKAAGKSDEEKLGAVWAASGAMQGEWSASEGLSNGDTVTYHFTASQEELAKLSKVRFRFKDITVKVTGLPEREVYDPFSEIEVTFEGFSGKGKVKIQTKEQTVKGLTFKASQPEGLSNGDTVTITCEAPNGDLDAYLAERGMAAEKSSCDVTVSGLTEMTSFDPFEYITVSFTGISPNGSIQVEQAGMPVGTLQFICEESGHIMTGQTVTLKIDSTGYGDIVDFCAKYGYTPSRLSCEYTADSLNRYATSLDDVSEEVLVRVDRAAEDFMQAYANKGMSGFPNSDYYRGVTRVGSAIISRKDLKPMPTRPTTRLYVLYEVSMEYEGTAMSYYYVFTYDNVLTDAQGQMQLDAESYRYTDNGYFKMTQVVFGKGPIKGNSGYGFKSVQDFLDAEVLSKTDEYQYDTDLLP